MDKFARGYMSGICFYDCEEKDFFIQAIGYNDFHNIKPIKVSRLQSIYTVHLVLHGSGTLILDGKKYAVHAHDMFFVPPDTSLCYYPDEDNLWDYVWFEFVGENAVLYAEKMGLSTEHPVTECKNFRVAYFSAYSLFEHYEQGKNIGYYNVLSLFYKLLDINFSAEKEISSNLAETVITYISCHYHKPDLTIKSICRDLGVSHSHLCRVFKQQTGFSLVHHLIDVRIKEACRLLKGSDLSIKEIAYSVGFSDNAHFMKTFKEHIGMTAGEYRNNYI